MQVERGGIVQDILKSLRLYEKGEIQAGRCFLKGLIVSLVLEGMDYRRIVYMMSNEKGLCGTSVALSIDGKAMASYSKAF